MHAQVGKAFVDHAHHPLTVVVRSFEWRRLPRPRHIVQTRWVSRRPLQPSQMSWAKVRDRVAQIIQERVTRKGRPAKPPQQSSDQARSPQEHSSMRMVLPVVEFSIVRTMAIAPPQRSHLRIGRAIRVCGAVGECSLS